MMSPNIATSPPTLSEKSDIASIPVAFYSGIRDFLTTRFMISRKDATNEHCAIFESFKQ